MAMMAFIVVSGIPMVSKVVIPEAAVVMTLKPNFISTVRTQRHLMRSAPVSESGCLGKMRFHC
jgi:hypothetical protein